LLLEACNSFKLLADQKGINFSVKTPGEAIVASVDTDSLQKILNNLLYNAFNYCRNNVEVTMSLSPETIGHFIIEVKNDGDLIPEALKEKIFEPFYRVKTTDNKAGSGIGLALSRSLASLHKGSIYFREGSERMNIFVLSLPLHQQVKSDKLI
jgi:signal transduction histidine kinase